MRLALTSGEFDQRDGSCAAAFSPHGGLKGVKLGTLNPPFRRSIDLERVSFLILGVLFNSLISAEDVAKLAVFLASEDSNKMTGQDLNIDAGALMD